MKTRFAIFAERGRWKVVIGINSRNGFYVQKMELADKGETFTLTSAQKDNFILEIYYDSRDDRLGS